MGLWTPRKHGAVRAVSGWAIRPRRSASCVRGAAIVGVSALVLLATGCDREAPVPAEAPKAGATATPGQQATGTSSNGQGADVVLTTFYPTEYFATRIAGGLIPVRCPLPDDADPIFWKPSAADIAEYQSAGLVVVNGATFEKWVARAPLPLSRVVETARPFAAEFVKFKTTTHSHGASGAHSHEGIDGHTWVDPQNAVRQAEQVLVAMSARWPQHEKAFRDNYRSLAADLTALDAKIKPLVPALKPARLLANHPAYNYLAKRHGLSIETVDIDPDAPLSAVAIEQLGKLRAGVSAPDAAAGATATPPKWIMLFESAPTDETQRRLEQEFSIASVVFSPCETLSAADRAAGLDYLKVMQANIDALQKALGVSAGSESTRSATPPSPPS